MRRPQRTRHHPDTMDLLEVLIVATVAIAVRWYYIPPQPWTNHAFWFAVVFAVYLAFLLGIRGLKGFSPRRLGVRWHMWKAARERRALERGAAKST